MLSMFTRKPKAPVEAEPVAPVEYIEAEPAEPVRRFEDMVAGKFEELERGI